MFARKIRRQNGLPFCGRRARIGAQTVAESLVAAKRLGSPRLLEPNRKQLELRASDLESLLGEDHRARLSRERDAYRWICGGVSVNYHALNDIRSVNERLWMKF